MQQNPPARRPRGRTTLNVAVWLLGLMMVAQLAAIGWALWRKHQPSADPAHAASTALSVAAPVATASPVVQAAPAEPTPTPAAPVASLDVPLPANASYFFESALASRERGDMKAAVTQLRAGCDLVPRHPRVLYELAVTYEQMALPNKAAEIWDRLFALGPAAGSYFKIAEMKFAEGPGNPPREVDMPIQLGKIIAVRDPIPSPLVQEQYNVRIPVQAKDSVSIDPTKVRMVVQFYDLVNGMKVEETSADLVPREGRWMSGTPQWLTNSVEFLDIKYQQPKLPVFGTTADDRHYYGYLVKLYYNDQLQDMSAEPKQLMRTAPVPGEDRQRAPAKGEFTDPQLLPPLR